VAAAVVAGWLLLHLEWLASWLLLLLLLLLLQRH
jgi:hypothetical protein